MSQTPYSVLITGAASGLGEAAARLFVSQGWQVFLVDRDQTRLLALVAALGSGLVRYQAADLSQAEEVASSHAAALAAFGQLDAVIFNAGICGANMPLEDYPEELFDEVLAINLKAVWRGLRAVVPAMKARGKGSIVITSSIQGLAALPGTTAYTTSKHALVGMMKGAALELAPFNVRVNTIHPGYAATPMMHTIHEMVSPDNPQQFEAAISASIPMKRYARAEEVAQLMMFLASDQSSYSTGGCFSADGGLLAALP